MIVDWNGELVDGVRACIGMAGQPSAACDGLYETLRCYAGVPFDMDAHVRRLRDGCAFLKLSCDVMQVKWRARVNALLEANELIAADARIRIVLHRTTGWETAHQYNLAILAWPVAAEALEERQRKGCSLTVASQPRLPDDKFHQLKSLNLLATAVAQREAADAGADETLFVNARGEICEAGYANVFVVAGKDTLRTPPVSSPCLPGVTRAHVLRLARREGWRVEENPIQQQDLASAEEIFLTSSVSELMPVISVNGRVVGEGRRGRATQLLQVRYKELVASSLAKTTT